MRRLACFALLVACTRTGESAPVDGGSRADVVDAAPNDATPDAAPNDATPDAAPNDATPDAAPNDVTRDATHDAVVCCPIEEPRCDCFSTGRRDPLTGMCMSICDVAPVGNVREVAADGCPYWRTTSQSCLSPPDGG
jgi:hypothetical protein